MRTKKEIYKDIKHWKRDVLNCLKENYIDGANIAFNNLEETWLELRKIGFSESDRINYGYYIKWKWEIEDILAA